MSEISRRDTRFRGFAATEQTVSNRAFIFLSVVFLLLACAVARAQTVTTLYWDRNGTTAGAGGPTPNGIWDTANALGNQNWSLSADGTVVTTTWVNGSNAVFSAGTDATGPFTVTLANSADITVNSITVEEGSVTIQGGLSNNSTETFSIGAGGITVNSGDVLTFALNATQLPTLTLSASQTWTDNGVVSISSGATVSLGTNTLTVTGTALTSIASTISGSGGLTKQGSGTLSLTASNTYTGATVISGGTLSADAAGALGSGTTGTSAITVNSGGTLLLSDSTTTDHIKNTATMTLNGGTFNTGGVSEHGATNNTAGIGALTLQSSSIIDLGSGSSVVAFANSSGQTWASNATLSIYNWSGTPVTGGGVDQLFFGNSSSGLTTAQLADIVFYSDSGTTRLGTGATILSTGEIIPIPEAQTWIVSALALGVLAHQLSTRRRADQSATRV